MSCDRFVVQTVIVGFRAFVGPLFDQRFASPPQAQVTLRAVSVLIPAIILVYASCCLMFRRLSTSQVYGIAAMFVAPLVVLPFAGLYSACIGTASLEPLGACAKGANQLIVYERFGRYIFIATPVMAGATLAVSAWVERQQADAVVAHAGLFLGILLMLSVGFLSAFLAPAGLVLDGSPVSGVGWLHPGWLIALPLALFVMGVLFFGSRMQRWRVSTRTRERIVAAACATAFIYLMVVPFVYPAPTKLFQEGLGIGLITAAVFALLTFLSGLTYLFRSKSPSGGPGDQRAEV